MRVATIFLILNFVFCSLAVAEPGDEADVAVEEVITEAEEPTPEEEAVETTEDEATPEAEEGSEEAEASESDEVGNLFVSLADAIGTQNWPVALGVTLMILVFLANKVGLKDRVGGKLVPWVTIGVGVLSTAGVALAAGTEIAPAIIAGVASGLAAVGSWEAFFKHLLTKKEAAS